MKIYQVYLINKEFIGMSKNDRIDPIVTLREVVNVNRQIIPSALVPGKGDMHTKMIALGQDPDYKKSSIPIHTGPNVIILELNPEGATVKQYMDTIKPKEMN